MPEPPKVNPFNVEGKQLYSKSLTNNRAAHPLAKEEPNHSFNLSLSVTTQSSGPQVRVQT